MKKWIMPSAGDPKHAADLVTHKVFDHGDEAEIEIGRERGTDNPDDIITVTLRRDDLQNERNLAVRLTDETWANSKGGMEKDLSLLEEAAQILFHQFDIGGGTLREKD